MTNGPQGEPANLISSLKLFDQSFFDAGGHLVLHVASSFEIQPHKRKMDHANAKLPEDRQAAHGTMKRHLMPAIKRNNLEDRHPVV